MTRVWLLAVVLAAGCGDTPPPQGPEKTTGAATGKAQTPKPAFKEPDPEIR